MYKISTFSKISNTPIQTLRYYDTLELLKPMSIGKYNSYRYYTNEQLMKLKIIKKLKRMGFKLQEILSIMKKYDKKFLILHKERLQKEIDSNLKSMKELELIIQKMDSKSQNFQKELVNLINKEERSKINMKEKYNVAKEKLLKCYEEYKNDNMEDCFILLEELKNDIFGIDDEMNPFWINTAGDLFTGITFEIFKNNKPEEVTFLNIFQFRINGEALMENMIEYVDSLSKDSYSYVCLSGIAHTPTETMGGIISTYKQKMKLYTMFESKK